MQRDRRWTRNVGAACGYGLGAVLLVLLLGWGGTAPVWAQTRAVEAAIAQAEAAAPPALNAPSPTFNSLWERLDRIREDRQLQRLVEDDLEKGFVIRSQIQEEVDRAFSHTTALINVMLGLLTFIPVLAAVGIWFIRRSVIGQITQETKQQLAAEVEKQFEQEIAKELKQQGEAFKQELAQLRTELIEQLAQVKGLVTSRTSATTATAATTAAATITATTYIKQGNALYLEACLEDAIAFYDKALQLEPENAQAWFRKGAALAKLQQLTAAIAAYDTAIQLQPDFFLGWLGKARCYAIQSPGNPSQISPMLLNLQQAQRLNADQYRDIVKTDPAFDGVRNHPEFQALIAK
jgi:tetratricopeptide (TPR) repeat protein